MMLGRAKCSECGGNKVLEIVMDNNQPLIRSKCLDCGFAEDEWLFGDDPSYLEYLAEKYNITVDDIKKALKEKVHLPTRIQETIYLQLKTLNFFFEADYKIKAVLAKDDGRTLRLHHRSGGTVINIDITYCEGSDTYQIKAYKILNHLDEEEIYNQDGFVWEQLEEVIHEILHKHSNID